MSLLQYNTVKHRRALLSGDPNKGAQRGGNRRRHQEATCQRVLVGEVQIKAHRWRLAPQPRLDPFPPTVISAFVCV